MLGFHQARYGYKDIEELESVLAKYDAINFPVESIWADIDHMDGYRDFTLHPEHFPEKRMRSFVQGLHLKNQKLVMILDPGTQSVMLRPCDCCLNELLSNLPSINRTCLSSSLCWHLN